MATLKSRSYPDRLPALQAQAQRGGFRPPSTASLRASALGWYLGLELKSHSKSIDNDNDHKDPS